MKHLRNNKGQIAVILIFFIAVLLAVFAVIMNISKLAQNRVASTIAVDTSAALMASSMASYAEGWFQGVVNLPAQGDIIGRLTRAEPGGTVYYIIDVLIAAVLLFVAIVSLIQAPAASPYLWGQFAVALLAVLGTTGVFVAQVAYISPEMSKMWSKMFKNLTVAEQFREQGLQSLLSSSVQDPVLIDDVGDFDMDGHFKGATGGVPAILEGDKEKVGRFSVLYTRRAEWLGQGSPEVLDVPKPFSKVLAKFMYAQEEPPPFHSFSGGLIGGGHYRFFKWDPNWDINSNDPAGVAPFGIKDKDKGGAPPAGTYFANQANENCAYGFASLSLPNCPIIPNSLWRYIYDKNWENPLFPNSGYSGTQAASPALILPFNSFREMIGRDDENPKIYFTPISQNPLKNPNGVIPQLLAPPQWTALDAHGLYRLLWEMDLMDLNLVDQVDSQDYRGCTWCGRDANQNTYSGCPVDFTGNNTVPPNIVLPYPEECSTDNPLYGSNLRDCWCLKNNVDSLNFTPASLSENACYDKRDLANFSWKKGANLYCSKNVPYDICSGKNCSSTCSVAGEGCPPGNCPTQSCGVVDNGLGTTVNNQPMWREDLVDFLRYDPEGGIDAFINQSEDILSFMSQLESSSLPGFMSVVDYAVVNVFRAGGQFNDFYRWIKIKDNVVDVTNYQLDDFDDLGGLQKWMVILDTIKNEIQAKKDGQFQGQPGGVCSAEQSVNGVATCYMNIISKIDNCLSSCSVQSQYCIDSANALGLPFNTTASPYDTQTTDCTMGNTDYVFLKELKNWRVKLVERHAYLIQRLSRMIGAINMLTDARNAIYNFLSNPFVEKMRQLMNPPPLSVDKGLAVYAWRDEAKPGQPADSGKWHIVRVKTQIPTLCGNKCGRTSCETKNDDPVCSDDTASSDSVNGGCKEPFMPQIKQWERDVSSHHYYSLIDYENPDTGEKKGCCGQGNSGFWPNWIYDYNKSSYRDAVKCFKGGLVRASLMRYDESGGALNWATGINFWKTKFKNPNAPPASTQPPYDFSPEDIETYCGPIMAAGTPAPGAVDPSIAQSIDNGCSYGVDGAFILNCISGNPNVPGSGNEWCWWVVNSLIKKQGVEADSCAEYFCRTGMPDPNNYNSSKFGFKFVDCPNRDWE